MSEKKRSSFSRLTAGAKQSVLLMTATVMAGYAQAGASDSAIIDMIPDVAEAFASTWCGVRAPQPGGVGSLDDDPNMERL